MSGVPYDGDFYGRLDGAVRSSAEIIAPQLLEVFRPTSVIDVGCGIGTWLSVFVELGVPDVTGVDGDHVDPATLAIPRDRFLPRDLERPLDLGRRYDLALSLEVAEHLECRGANAFVDSLTSLAPVVVFSAAVPHQGGRHHINEQWQDWWAAKFSDRGYTTIDMIRPAAWDDERVLPWYAQNCLVFADAETVATRDLQPATSYLRLVHPSLWELAHNPPPSLRASLLGAVRHASAVPKLTVDAVRRRVSGAN
jgi:SAM-dependent methyltransferase